jgi:hypothetical protein
VAWWGVGTGVGSAHGGTLWDFKVLIIAVSAMDQCQFGAFSSASEILKFSHLPKDTP